MLPWKWLAEDNSAIRNVIEALGWIATVLGSSLALVIAGVWRWLRQPSREDEPAVETVWLGRALHLKDGLPPRVAEVGLLDLGVKPAMDTDSDADLPPFVARDEDENLEWAIAQGGMVLLHGRAASGKSRAGIEAIRRLRPNDALIVPSDGPALRRLAEHGADFTNVVVWLDDLERFLAPGGLDQGLLHRLCPEGSRGAIVATMRDEELSHYDHAVTSNAHETTGISRNAVELIEQLRDRRRVQLKERLSEVERTRAAGQHDHRIHSALGAEEGFGEYLAAGRAMLGRWSTGDGEMFHVGQAIISAAVDCRRAGYHQPIPESTLKELYAQYLAPGWRHRADLPGTSDGIKWGCKRVLGASSCLLPRPNGMYLAADYLLDSTKTVGTPLTDVPVPLSTWHAVLSLAAPQEAFNIGLAARDASNDSVAEEAFRIVADAGHPIGMFALGLVLTDRGEKEEAESWQRQAAEAGYEPAMSELADFLDERGEKSDAESWHRKAAEAGYEIAMCDLGILLDERGEKEEAEAWQRQAAEAGYELAMSELGVLLAERGEKSEAEAWQRKAAESGYKLAMSRLGRIFAERGEKTEAMTWHRKAAEAGSAVSMWQLAKLLSENGDKTEAESWLRKSAETGFTPAFSYLGLILAERGERQEAEAWQRRAAEAGHESGMSFLGELLADRGDKDEAEAWLRRAAESGHDPAMSDLGDLLAERGEKQEAEAWQRKAAEAGYSPAMSELALLLAERGELAESDQWQFRAAEAGYGPAMFDLGLLLVERGEEEEAEAWQRRGAEAGYSPAMLELGGLLADRGKDAEAEVWLRRAAEAGFKPAMSYLGHWLAERGEKQEAEAWHREAAG